MPRRVLVIGLDCAPPALVFEGLRERMPNIAALMDRGCWGPLRSTVPPITVPAWVSMTTGRDPGELGLFGFRNRVAGRYELALPTSADVRFKRVWDLLGDAGRRVAALFVPLTWPPTPVRGTMVSGFMTPGPEQPWAFPAAARDRFRERFGEYRADVADFRSTDLDRVLAELRAMAEQHFDVAAAMWTEERPDFLMMVEMGPDRLHHAAFQHLDPAHPRHAPGHPAIEEARGYYAYLDERIGELTADVDDDTTVLIVSDHGARPMLGGFRINEWLRQRGWLALREEPADARALDSSAVDWSRTRAWAEGGYYARVFLNVAGREPEGIVPAAEREATRDQLRRALSRIERADGGALDVQALAPENIYRQVRGAPPDLMVFLDDLALRSIGTVGGDEGLFVETNDTGPDACNHDWDGIVIMAGAGIDARGRLEGASILDVTPTILSLFGIDAPPGLAGRDLSRASQ